MVEDITHWGITSFVLSNKLFAPVVSEKILTFS